ncbi:hypothetical protein AcV7_010086 [Taiwanofungus camphoratus]|nr:hypothetical protein AcV7_010086 [Antrodia cinnamomea]
MPGSAASRPTDCPLEFCLSKGIIQARIVISSYFPTSFIHFAYRCLFTLPPLPRMRYLAEPVGRPEEYHLQ